MHELLGGARGEYLTAEAMNEDYRQRFGASEAIDSWKLERRQHFRDPQFRSWEAFDRGDWPEALRLLDDERAELTELQRDTQERGFDLYRVRVVDEPVVPYLQWELHLLALRAEYGEKIRVVESKAVRRHETDCTLPELLTVGADTVYEFVYDDTATLLGANRYVDPVLRLRCTEFMRRLYAHGEEVTGFFHRRVANMPPPQRP